MHCDKVDQVKDLQCGVWPGSFQPLRRYGAENHSWTGIFKLHKNCTGAETSTQIQTDLVDSGPKPRKRLEVDSFNLNLLTV